MSKKIGTINPPKLSDTDAVKAIKAGHINQTIKPSEKVMKKFAKGIFTQQDLIYLINYGARDNSKDYINYSKKRWIYGLTVTDKDQRKFSGLFDIKNNTCIYMEDIK